jgi:hypothetical protein
MKKCALKNALEWRKTAQNQGFCINANQLSKKPKPL